MTNPLYPVYVKTERLSIPNGAVTRHLIRAIDAKLDQSPRVCFGNIDPENRLDYKIIREYPSWQIDVLLQIVPSLTPEQAELLKAKQLDFDISPFTNFDLNFTKSGADAIGPDLLERVRAELQGPRRFLYHAEDYVIAVLSRIRPF